MINRISSKSSLIDHLLLLDMQLQLSALLERHLVLLALVERKTYNRTISTEICLAVLGLQ